MEQYCVCCDKYADLLDDSCEKYQRVLSDRAVQYARIQAYNSKIEQFAISAASFYNVQVSEDVKVLKEISPTNSVHSFSSQHRRTSRWAPLSLRNFRENAQNSGNKETVKDGIKKLYK